MQGSYVKIHPGPGHVTRQNWFVVKKANMYQTHTKHWKDGPTVGHELTLQNKHTCNIMNVPDIIFDGELVGNTRNQGY